APCPGSARRRAPRWRRARCRPADARRRLREAWAAVHGAEAPDILIHNDAAWRAEFGGRRGANEAVRRHRQLWQRRLSDYGPDSPTTAISLDSLGRAWGAAGRDESALTLLREAI